MKMVFVASIIMHELCIIYAFFVFFFVQKSFLTKNCFLIAVILWLPGVHCVLVFFLILIYFSFQVIPFVNEYYSLSRLRLPSSLIQTLLLIQILFSWFVKKCVFKGLTWLYKWFLDEERIMLLYFTYLCFAERQYIFSCTSVWKLKPPNWLHVFLSINFRFTIMWAIVRGLHDVYKIY